MKLVNPKIPTKNKMKT